MGLALALLAALCASAALGVGALPHARQAALLENLEGAPRAALERYLNAAERIQARWLVLQALLLLLSAMLWRATGTTMLASIGVPLASYTLATLVPYTLASRNPERAVPRLLVVVAPLDALMVPVVDPLVAATQWISQRLARAPVSMQLTETEVEIMVNEGEQSGALAHDQSEMIRNVLEFRDTHAGDLMIPRTQVTAVRLDTPAESLMSLVADAGHSRYPVFKDRIDDIVGVLHIKDLFLDQCRNPQRPPDLNALLRKATFIPETQPASAVLAEMRAGRQHMSIVIDEYGGMSGILTLEDLLEEIVGDIRDEYDDDESAILPLKDGGYLVDASLPITELSRQAGIVLPIDGEYNSVGGFIVEEMGRVPESGATMQHNDLLFTIRASDERRILKVQIAPASLAASA